MRSSITAANCRPQEDRNTTYPPSQDVGTKPINFQCPPKVDIFFQEKNQTKPEAQNNQSAVITGPFKRGCLLQGNV